MQEKELKRDDISEQMKDKPEFALEIKYNGELMSLDKDKAIELAQKGMNYDHVYEELIRLREDKAETEAYEKTTPQAADQPTVEDMLQGFAGFFRSHPDVKGLADIPAEVLEDVIEGKPIEEAFLACENRMLKSRLAEIENSKKCPGALHTEGREADDDAFLEMLLAKL